MTKAEYDALMQKIEEKMSELGAGHKQSMDELKKKLTKSFPDAQKATGKDAIDRLTNSVSGLKIRMTDVNEIGNGISFTPFLDKGEDAKTWLRDFENCADFKGFDSGKQLKVLRILLKNGAATWLDNFVKTEVTRGASDNDKLKQVKDKYLERFCQDNEWLQEHLIMFLNQKPTETVQQYYSTLLTRSAKLNKSQNEIKTMFIRGLLNPLKMFVITREPDTLEKAFKLAKDVESLQVISDITSDARQSIHALNMPGEIVGRKIDYGQAEVKNELELGELREELKKLQKQVEKQKVTPQPSQIPRAMRCHYCNLPGHRIAECRKRLREVVQRRQPFRQPNPANTRGYRFSTTRPLPPPPFRPGGRPPVQNGYHAPNQHLN